MAVPAARRTESELSKELEGKVLWQTADLERSRRALQDEGGGRGFSVESNLLMAFLLEIRRLWPIRPTKLTVEVTVLVAERDL